MSHQTQQTSTELALAFSLDNPKQPCQQPVYAFLPMRSYGLRFVLQADWQMPSSREAVDADSAWNQALRDHVPDMLLAAMEAFSNLADDQADAVEDPPAVAAGPADQTAAAGTGKAVPPADSAAAHESQAHNAPAEHAHVQEQQQQQGPTLQKQQQKQKESIPKLAAQLSHAGWLDCWLRCLPVEGEAQGFFAALPYR
jgi:hypothetical protein